MKWFAAILAICLAGPATACVSGAKCIIVPNAQKTPQLEIGDHLPRGEYQVLLNSRYAGLPRPDAGTVYYRVDHRILRVEMNSLKILEDMTYVAGRVTR